MAKSPIFSGFSSIQGLDVIHDEELIKQDLLNQINTRKGERLMDPEYGCIVWDLIFELKSASILSEIETDLRRIVNSEPRVMLQNIQILEEEHGYIGVVELYFNEFKSVGSLQVEFNQRILNQLTGI